MKSKQLIIIINWSWKWQKHPTSVQKDTDTDKAGKHFSDFSFGLFCKFPFPDLKSGQWNELTTNSLLHGYIKIVILSS